MPLDLSSLSIGEIRRRFLQGGEGISGQLLARLRKDPRQGVRRIHDTLKKRLESEREERTRLDSMLNFERVLWKTGITRIAGVDEAGVGPLAGPVVAAAVVFAPGTEIEGVDDSKRLDPERREELADQIRATAAGVAVGVADVGDVDRLNVYHAAILAMRRAVEALPERPQHLLIDAREIAGLDIPQNPFEKGDGINFSIAAASIVAKTHRDRLMVELDRRYPEYGFVRHKGYGTREHQEAIRAHGPCPVHRASFGFVRELCGEFSERFYALRDQLGAADTREELARFEDALGEARDALPEEEYRKLRLMLSRSWQTV
jgi:ribonuclease HII